MNKDEQELLECLEQMVRQSEEIVKLYNENMVKWYYFSLYVYFMGFLGGIIGTLLFLSIIE